MEAERRITPAMAREGSRFATAVSAPVFALKAPDCEIWIVNHMESEDGGGAKR